MLKFVHQGKGTESGGRDAGTPSLYSNRGLVFAKSREIEGGTDLGQTSGTDGCFTKDAPNP